MLFVASTHALPDVRDLRTSGNCCYQSPPFLWPRDQKKRRLWGLEWRRFKARVLRGWVINSDVSDPNAGHDVDWHSHPLLFPTNAVLLVVSSDCNWNHFIPKDNIKSKTVTYREDAHTTDAALVIYPRRHVEHKTTFDPVLFLSNATVLLVVSNGCNWNNFLPEEKIMHNSDKSRGYTYHWCCVSDMCIPL